MIEFKVEVESANGDTIWDIDLYSNGKFVKTICTCYEEDYAYTIAHAIASRAGAKVR